MPLDVLLAKWSVPILGLGAVTAGPDLDGQGWDGGAEASVLVSKGVEGPSWALPQAGRSTGQAGLQGQQTTRCQPPCLAVARGHTPTIGLCGASSPLLNLPPWPLGTPPFLALP